MLRVLVTLLIVAFLCVSVSAQCASSCDKEGQTCGDKKDGQCCDTADGKVCEKGDKCCKNEKVAKKDKKEKKEVVKVVKCEKSGKEVACIKVNKDQYAALQKHFAAKDKEGKEHKFAYLHLSKVQKAAILEVLKIEARDRVPVQKEELLENHVWVIVLEKAPMILGEKEKVAEAKTEAKS